MSETILIVVAAVFLGCLLGMLSSALSDRTRRRREAKRSQDRFRADEETPHHMRR